MKKSKRKGFTLVELLVTIVLLGIIGGIVIYNMTNISKNTQDNDYDRFVAEVKSAASVYADMHPDAFNELYVSRAYIYITLGDLVSYGGLDEDLKNPYTKEKIDLKELVKASLDSTNGAVTFEYPLKDTKSEQTLVAMSDYVVWGEPYDCMRGLGSYELSLSDEDGNLINLEGTDANGVKNIDKYNFTCTLPSEFENYTNPRTGKVGKRTVQAGNYDIVYNWVTESGVRKQATRVLRVLAKVKPSFKTNVTDYDFGNDVDVYQNKFQICSNCDSENFYQTSYNNDGSWNYLTYQPFIEGADVATTELKITKRKNDPELGGWENVTNGYVRSFPETQVDDGDKVYKLDVIVHGHYDTDYQYEASGEGRFKAELVVPEPYISSQTPNAWATENTYLINSDTTGKQSPVGIAKYEFKLTNDANVNKRIDQVSDNLFTKNAVITNKDVTLLKRNGETCPDKSYEYTNIYFRAINREGYAGKWTRYNTKLTNQLTNLVEQSSIGCTSAANCCLSSGGSCYFQNKVIYASYKSQLLVVLERYSSDKSMLLALDGVTGKLVSPLSVKKGYAEQQTCDMLVWKHYTYNVANDEILKEANRWASEVFGNSGKLLTPAIPGGASRTAYTLTGSLLQKYSNAVYASPEYWLLDSGSERFTVYLDQPHKHANESTTATNAFFYYASALTKHKQYGGQRSYVKPLVRATNVNICSGDGTRNNPYVLAL